MSWVRNVGDFADQVEVHSAPPDRYEILLSPSLQLELKEKVLVEKIRQWLSFDVQSRIECYPKRSTVGFLNS